jgi:hypothetical protein
MLEMSGVLREGREGYVVRAPGTPIILIDRNHMPTQQYLKAFGKELLEKKVQLVIVDQADNFWRAQISPEELKAKGFSRMTERR